MPQVHARSIGRQSAWQLLPKLLPSFVPSFVPSRPQGAGLVPGMALAPETGIPMDLRLDDPMTLSNVDGADPWHTTLERRANELAEQLQSTLAESRETVAGLAHQDVPDDVDVAELRLRSALRHAERERDVEELREVEAARSRLAAGVFGLCTECGLEIEAQRLQARPACARCMDCQLRHERLHPTRIQIPRSL